METKGITCKIPFELHQQLKEEQECLSLTMNQYIEMDCANILHRKGKSIWEK